VHLAHKRLKQDIPAFIRESDPLKRALWSATAEFRQRMSLGVNACTRPGDSSLAGLSGTRFGIAIVALLSRPDDPDLHRGYRLVLEGKADRYRLVPQLASAFIQAKLLELSERRDVLSEVSVAVEAAPAGRSCRADERLVPGDVGFHTPAHC
jgi:hypothetical protein